MVLGSLIGAKTKKCKHCVEKQIGQNKDCGFCSSSHCPHFLRGISSNPVWRRGSIEYYLRQTWKKLSTYRFKAMPWESLTCWHKPLEMDTALRLNSFTFKTQLYVGGSQMASLCSQHAPRQLDHKETRLLKPWLLSIRSGVELTE